MVVQQGELYGDAGHQTPSSTHDDDRVQLTELASSGTAVVATSSSLYLPAVWFPVNIIEIELEQNLTFCLLNDGNNIYKQLHDVMQVILIYT